MATDLPLGSFAPADSSALMVGVNALCASLD
jgi:hypothetical protein